MCVCVDILHCQASTATPDAQPSDDQQRLQAIHTWTYQHLCMTFDLGDKEMLLHSECTCGLLPVKGHTETIKGMRSGQQVQRNVALPAIICISEASLLCREGPLLVCLCLHPSDQSTVADACVRSSMFTLKPCDVLSSHRPICLRNDARAVFVGCNTADTQRAL